MTDNSRTISLHDQYLTASPYDDEPDWAEPPYNVRCPKCGGDIFEELGGDYPTYNFRCDDCGHEWNQNVEKPAITKEQQDRLNRLAFDVSKLRAYRIKWNGLTLDEFFESAPEDGDFKWEDGEGGDWNACNCGYGWHKVAYSLDMGRKNGNRFVILYEIDCEGEWEEMDSHYENEDLHKNWDRVAEIVANQVDEFFLGWAEYWIDAAETGNDPCEQCIGKPEGNWVDFCIKAVEDNIKYFNMGRK